MNPTQPPQAPGAPNQDQMMLDYLMEMGAMQPQQDALTQQRAMVEQLRQGGQNPQMRGNGRLQQAAHPLEFLSSMANNGMAEYKNQQANQMQDALGTAKRGVLQNARSRMQPQAQPFSMPSGVEM